jgi:tetratricopeptide (TPR) repeat protein
MEWMVVTDLVSSESLFDDLDPTAADSPEVFVALLREVRQRAGRTYADLCRATRQDERPLTKATLSAVLNGNSHPNAVQTGQILMACGFSKAMASQWIKVLTGLRRDRRDVALLGPADARRARTEELEQRAAELTVQLAAEQTKCRLIEEELRQLRERGDAAGGAQELERLLDREQAYSEQLDHQLASVSREFATSRGNAPGQAGLWPRGCALPSGENVFVGRADLLAGMDRTGVLWLSGRPGVGTSEVAIQWAHLVSPTFDMVLYVDLEGLTPGRRRDAADAAHDLAVALTGARLPDYQAYEAAYEYLQTGLAGTNTLIVLDNAYDAPHVAPIVRAAANATVVVASRQRAQDLTNQSVHVSVLDRADAVALLAWFVPSAEPAALARIAELCDDLPLALRIVIPLIVGKPHVVPTVLRRLDDGQQRLNYLSANDRAVRGTILLSYSSLSSDTQRVARYLAVSFGAVSDAAELAVGLQIDEATVELALLRLTDASLSECAATDADDLRFSLAPLIRLTLAERSAAEDDPADVADFHMRTAQYVAGTLDAAADTPYAYRLRPPAMDPLQGELVEMPRARAALDAAVKGGWRDIAEKIAAALARLHVRHGDLTALMEIADILVTTQLAADRPEAALQTCMETTERLCDSTADRQDALTWAKRAAMTARHYRQPRLEVEAWMMASNIAIDLDDVNNAIEFALNTLSLLDSTFSAGETISPLLNIGRLYTHLQQYDKAEPHLRRAVNIAEQAGDVLDRANAQFDLAVVLGELGLAGEAIQCYDKASLLFAAIGEHNNAAVAQQNSADLTDERSEALTRWTEAARHWRSAPEEWAYLASALVNVSALSYVIGRTEESIAALVEADQCILLDLPELTSEIWVRQAALRRLRNQHHRVPEDIRTAHELVLRAWNELAEGRSLEPLVDLVSHPVLHPAPPYDFWLYAKPSRPDLPPGLPEL